jgi:tetratricopeptide (TPR) repeat protein
MLVDRGLLVRTRGGWVLADYADLPLPETVQATIAARLDLLPAQEKTVLQDAAVVGRVVWAGAVAKVAGRGRWAVQETLDDLARKQFLTLQRPSSVSGDEQYAFAHSLIRDVAYATIVRATRAEKHQRAAEWIEALAAERDDRLELIAHHYREAYRYADQARAATRDELRVRAVHALSEAAKHATHLNAFPAAAALLSEARSLSESADADYPQVMADLAEAAFWAGDQHADEVFDEARDVLLRAGDPDRAALVEVEHSALAWLAGDRKQAERHHRRAVELITDREPVPLHARTWAELSTLPMMAGQEDEALLLLNYAERLARQFGLRDVLIMALTDGGQIRHRRGEWQEAREQIRSALELAGRQADIRRIYSCAHALAEAAVLEGALAEAYRWYEVSEEAARNLRAVAVWRVRERLGEDYWRGDWTTVRAVLEELAQEDAQHYLDSVVARHRGLLCLAEGDLPAASLHAEETVTLAEAAGDPQVILTAQIFKARVLRACSRTAEAGELAESLADPTTVNWAQFMGVDLPIAARHTKLAHVITQETERRDPVSRWLVAADHFVKGEYQDAASTYARIGSLPDEAYARFQAGKQLIAKRREAEGEIELETALRFWRRVEATAYVREGEALLAHAASG